MNCACPSRLDLTRFARRLRDAAALMVGQGDYDAYAAHAKAAHPETPALTREEYFRARQDARFGAAGERAFRCC